MATQPTVVVVQQPQTITMVAPGPDTSTTKVVEDVGRQPRWAYSVFGIAAFCWHFLFGWMTFIIGDLEAESADSGNPSNYAALFLFCGFLPSTMTWIWLLNDSTVHCANPGVGMITKICCCDCISVYFMSVPAAIMALLRFIFWCVVIGVLLDLVIGAEQDAGVTGKERASDNFFFAWLGLASFDVGPMVYLSVDWYYYYGRLDFNGVLGTHNHPLRCAVAQSIPVMIMAWSLIAIFEEYVDEAASLIWPWILHGLVSTIILGFGAFVHFTGGVVGNKVSNAIYKFVFMGLGIALTVLVLIVCGYVLSWTFGIFAGYWFETVILFIVLMYYIGLTVPTIWALFSFQVGDV